MTFSIKIIDLGATFSTAELDAIRLAANDWAQYIASDFVEVPAQTKVKVANPIDPNFPNLKEEITLSTAIQDIRILVGARPRVSSKLCKV